MKITSDKKGAFGFGAFIQRIQDYFTYPNVPGDDVNTYQRFRFRMSVYFSTIKKSGFAHASMQLFRCLTIWSLWYQQLFSPGYRAWNRYQSLIKNISKDYFWIDHIEQFYIGDTGVDEYWLNVIVKDKYNQYSFDKDPLNLREKFEKDLKEKYLNLKIDLSHFNTFHPSWNNQIEQEMEPILKGKLRSFHYRFDDERTCYND